MRRTVYLGANLQTTVDVRGPTRRSWPDLDTAGVLTQSGNEALAGAKAIALAYETDWDLLRFVFADGDAELLGPGRILSTADSNGAARAIKRIEPVTPAPATRLYDATALRRGLYKPEANAQSRGISQIDGDYFWNGPGVLALYRWNGSVWTFSANYVAGNGLPFNDSVGGLHARPVDYSFDADQAFNVADYMLAGLVPYTSQPFRSEFAFDAHGQWGDPRQPPPYPASAFLTPADGRVRFADLSPLFFARLALDVFDSCPEASYTPRLAPSRFVSFADIALTGGDAAPSAALLTFPCINAKRIEFLFRNDAASTGNVFAALVSPAPTDSIGSLAGVSNFDPPPAAQFATVVPGQELSVVLAQPAHPFCKIIIGASAAATLRAPVLSIKRDVEG